MKNKFSLHKFAAITQLKFKSMFNKNLIAMPIMAIGMTILLRFLYSSILDGEKMPDFLLGMALSLGLMFSVTMTGMLVTSTVLAEEKEKYTLRTLMTSSVTSLEFFFGSIIPPFVTIMVVNIVLIPVSGLTLSFSEILSYLLITAIGSITSCIIGMIIGIFAKDQMSAGTFTTPVMLIFAMIPVFASMVSDLDNISRFLYTGVITDMVNAFAGGESYTLEPLSAAVLVGTILIAIGLFVIIYKRNGYETD